MLDLRRLCMAWAASLLLAAHAVAASSVPTPLSVGETWTIDSVALGETRRINVYLPPGMLAEQPLPVLYMPDGGLREDFLHIAGLLQVGAGNGTTRPFLLVGIENTERRRDLTGPTDVIKDRAIAPRVGGSQKFRDFLRRELMPEVARRYRITAERAIVGESLAGLFVIETLFTEPDLFDTFIAIDPSLWWNDGQLARRAGVAALLIKGKKAVYVASSSDASMAVNWADFGAALKNVPGLVFKYDAWPGETHATIFHPAALKAFRAALRPPPARP